MGNQFILIWSLLILSIVLSCVYRVDAAGTCSDHDMDCLQCQKFTSFNCNFVTKTDNKTVTKCLNDEELHKWAGWVQLQEKCSDPSDNTAGIATSTPKAVNATSSPAEENNNNSKEANDTIVINPPEKNTNTDDKKKIDKSDDDKKSDEPNKDDKKEDGDKSQNNKPQVAPVDPNKNVTDNSTHEAPDVTSKPEVTKPSTTVATVNDTKIANKTEEAASKSEDNHSFHGGSFIGGIILVICISFVIFFGIRYYKAHRDGRPFSHRLFGNGGGFAAERHDSDEPGFPF